jgi:hypothetical protein
MMTGAAQHGSRHFRLRHPHEIFVSVAASRDGGVFGGNDHFCYVLQLPSIGHCRVLLCLCLRRLDHSHNTMAEKVSQSSGET